MSALEIPQLIFVLPNVTFTFPVLGLLLGAINRINVQSNLDALNPTLKEYEHRLLRYIHYQVLA